MDPATASSPATWVRRFRNGSVLIGVLIALYALLGFLVLPILAKPTLEALATQRLDRPVTLGRLEFNPFTLRTRLSEFSLADRDRPRSLARFATLDLDLAVASLWKRAPVFDAVRLVRPEIDVTRNDDGMYSIDDLIARAAARPDAAATA